MKNMVFALALALVMIGCGSLQINGKWDIFDVGFFLSFMAWLMVIVGSGRDFAAE